MKLNVKLCLLLCSLLFSFPSFANLLITPTRVHFDARERTEEIIVVNTADDVRSYALSWDEKRQDETGRYVKLQGKELEQFNKSSDYVRFSPRRITLSPGENQRIKLMLRRTSSMPNEEFHSHLKFTLIPNSVTAPVEEEETEGLSIKMNFFLNYAIPIIVKNHTKESELSFANPIFNPNGGGNGNGSVQLEVLNKSQTHAHGNFSVLFKPLGASDFTAVGFDNAVNIFHEVDIMKRSIPLITPISGQSGLIKVVFEGVGESKNMPEASVLFEI